jgi:hypothetical protein
MKKTVPKKKLKRLDTSYMGGLGAEDPPYYPDTLLPCCPEVFPWHSFLSDIKIFLPVITSKHSLVSTAISPVRSDTCTPFTAWRKSVYQNVHGTPTDISILVRREGQARATNKVRFHLDRDWNKEAAVCLIWEMRPFTGSF